MRAESPSPRIFLVLPNLSLPVALPTAGGYRQRQAPRRRVRFLGIHVCCSETSIYPTSRKGTTSCAAKYCGRAYEAARLFPANSGDFCLSILLISIDEDGCKMGICIKAGRSVNVAILLRAHEAFPVPVAQLLRGLDKGIYSRGKKPKILP